ncbi:MAG: adenine phosphoribosyltransferase [Candidatus Micrarchaeaceae archaeon]
MFNEKSAKGLIRDINDYPKKGILFRDVTTLIGNPKAFNECIDELASRLKGKRIDCIIGIEARGFIIGSALSYKMHAGFIPVRKKGRLPYKTISKRYSLEYGTDSIEMHSDAIKKGSSVLIADDLLATGGTAKAAAELAEQAEGKVAALAFLIELSALNGRDKLNGYDVISLIKY